MVSIYKIFEFFHKYKIKSFCTGFLLYSFIPATAYNPPISPYRFCHQFFFDSSDITPCYFSFLPDVLTGPFLFYKSWPFIIIFFTTILLVILIMMRKSLNFARYRFKLEGIINKRTEELLLQKEKVDELLSNMLPKDTADQLKLTGKARTQKYNMVSILFSDIEGFTRIAEQMNPEVLVDELDKFFFRVDTLVEEFNIEKIKTIGDAYMAAGGIPDSNRTNPVDVVLAAIRIMQYMKQLKKENEYFWDLRIGIHTGPVIAGVVGQKRFSYDIWGDSVNIASRMESSGEAGKINISGSTYDYVKDFFICDYRGKMPVKYKGNIDMYFIRGFRPEFSIDMNRQEPNERFFLNLQLLRLKDIEEVFLKRMEEELPAALYFHNYKYCVDLLTQSELLFGSEKMSEEDRLLVKTAALLDCMSYLKGYTKRSVYTNQLTRELLPKYHYRDKQIEEIARLISMPLLPPLAKSLPEKVLSDARLSFLGKNNFADSVNSMYKEMKLFGQISSKTELIQNLSGFLKSFQFYTLTAQKLAEISSIQQVETLKQMNEKPDQSPTKI